MVPKHQVGVLVLHFGTNYIVHQLHCSPITLFDHIKISIYKRCKALVALYPTRSNHFIPTCPSPKFAKAWTRSKRVASFIAKIQYISPPDFHFLVLVVFEPQAADILPHTRYFRAVEGCRFRVAREDVFADMVVREEDFGRWDGEQGRGRGFVDLAWGAGFVWFGVLDFVAIFLPFR